MGRAYGCRPSELLRGSVFDFSIDYYAFVYSTDQKRGTGRLPGEPEVMLTIGQKRTR